MMIKNTTASAARTFNTRRGQRRPRSINGTSNTTSPQKPKNSTPNTSPSSHSDVENVRRQLLERLEHEQEIPLGLDPLGRRAEGIGLLAKLPGKQRRQRRQQAQRHVPADHVAEEKMRDKRHRRHLLGAAVPPHGAIRNAHPVLLHQKKMHADQGKSNQRKNDDVQGIEPRQGVAGNVLAAAGQQQQVLAHDRHHARRSPCPPAWQKTPIDSTAASSR